MYFTTIFIVIDKFKLESNVIYVKTIVLSGKSIFRKYVNHVFLLKR